MTRPRLNFPVLMLGGAALLSSETLPAADSCSLAKARLEESFFQLPHACRESAQCDGYFYRADSCSAAVVLAKPGVSKAGEPRLLALQSAVREACAAEFANHPVCSPQPYHAVCRDAHCVDAASTAERPGVANPNGPHRFLHATIARSCAPWDGPALAVTLSNAAGCASATTPYLRISLWRDLPLKAGKTITFDIRNTNGQASRCLKPDECEAAVSGSVTLDAVDEGKRARGRYELRFKNGLESGIFEAGWCEERALCG